MNQRNKWIYANEGAKILKMDPKRFFYYVKTRNIETKQGESERKTLYSFSDVMRVSKELGIDQKLSTYVDWVKPSDIISTLALDYLVYQEAILGDINLYISWVKKNGQISIAAFDENDRKNVLAYIAMLPLNEELIIKILKGEMKETDIKAEDIEDYTRKGAYTLLAESAVCHPEHPEKLGEVLRFLLDHWCNIYPERYIDKIYAQSASDSGDILIQKLFFSPLYNLAKDAYVLDLSRPGASRFVKHFQECIRKKAEAN